MYYESMPLYPALRPGCDREACVRVPVFDEERCRPARMPDECRCRRVTIENPCRPGELAEVLLGVDDCGNLVVCVRRDCAPGCPPCRPERHPRRPCPPPGSCLPRAGCGGGGRLYGSWG